MCWITQVLFNWRMLALAGCMAFCAVPASAAVETDPTALYQTMRHAYDEAGAHGWSFDEQSYYLATILDAGRAYALFRAQDPQYGELATLTVDVGSRLHYNPLTNNDAALWYVREAAQWVVKNGSTDAPKAQAQALLDRVNAAEGDPKLTAQSAEEDAAAVAKDFPADPDARVLVIIADVRAYQLTKDPQYRSLLLTHAADARLSLVRVPATEAQVMFQIAEQAANALAGYSAADAANGKIILDRRARIPALQEIGHVHALPHGLRMTRTAPADEYFGALGFSPIGIDNELTRVGKYLDAGWGERMSKDALHLEEALVGWHRLYPRDITLPKRVLGCYELLKRIATPQSMEAAEHLRTMLLVEYPESSQARELAAA